MKLTTERRSSLLSTVTSRITLRSQGVWLTVMLGLAVIRPACLVLPSDVATTRPAFGSGLQPSLHNLSFAIQVVGTTSTARQITITNPNFLAVTIHSVVASGNFQETDNCTAARIPAFGSCSISVTFHPGNTGVNIGSIAVTDDVDPSPIVISISGIGVAPVVLSSPSTEFTASVGSTSSSKTFTLTNYQNSPVGITSITASGNFNLASSCVSPLAARAACPIQLSFSPTVSGTINGALTVLMSNSPIPQVIGLVGIASGSSASTLLLSPAIVGFSNQVVNTQSGTKTITLTNNGAQSVTVSRVSSSGDFGQTNTCLSVSLPQGGQCTITATFTPRVTGAILGAITILDTSATSPHVISLSGTGIGITTFSPSSVNFGSQLANTTSAAHTVLITNNQSTSLDISSVIASPGYVVASSTCSSAAPLTPNGSCQISITFRPTRTGSFNGALSVSTSAGPQILNLWGLGVRTTNMNPVQLENAKPGDASWRVSNVAQNHEIEGYASATSITRGQSITFFVNTTDTHYSLDIYRVGWYAGVGARRMLPSIVLSGVHQPSPTTDSTTLLVQCNWTASYALAVPDDTSDPTDWMSGAYLVKLTASTSGKQNYIVFVVRDDTRRSDLLFQSSVTTYAAYNTWGGYSLYSTPQARKVSFDRPYIYNWGTGDFIRWEINMTRFLEREGYDVTYNTDVDTHSNGSLLLNHKAFLSVGHDEYWSWQMRDNTEAARAQGVSLGFFDADAAYWQIRFEPSTITGVPNRTVVCYKSLLDPYYNDGNPNDQHLVTVRFRDFPVNRPEDTMIGVMYQTGNVQGDIMITGTSNWFYQDTGLQNGDHLFQLEGYEADAMSSGTPTGTQVLAQSPYFTGAQMLFANTTEYSTSSGSTVVGAGTIQWSWGLDDFRSSTTSHPILVDAAMQQVMRNILAKFGANAPGQ